MTFLFADGVSKDLTLVQPFHSNTSSKESSSKADGSSVYSSHKSKGGTVSFQHSHSIASDGLAGDEMLAA